MSKGKKLFGSEDFDKRKKLFNPDDFDKPSGEPTNGPSCHNKQSIIIGIVAAATILIGICFFAIKNNSGDANVGSKVEQVALTEEATVSGNPEIADKNNANAESATTNAENTKSSDVNEAPAAAEEGNVPTTAKLDEKKADKQSVNESQTVQQPSLTKPTPPATCQETATPVNGSVEENARRAIRGDFGNGQTRKDKLGASYPEIQGRVNEMYRQGLIL